MHNTISLTKVNESYFKIDTEPSILKELSEYFTFEVPGHKFMPLYRYKMWDGKKRLINYVNRNIYCGLLPYIKKFAKDNTYDLVYENFDDAETSFSVKEAEDFFTDLRPCSGDGNEITPHDYQISTIRTAIQRNRAVIVSPTASGKSLCIYALVRWYEQLGKKILVILPGTGLVDQLFTDFCDYSKINGWDVESNCHKIYSGKAKDIDKPVTLSTWQSIYKLKKWFSQFDVVIGDECHNAKAVSLTAILEKSINAEYRFGFTATLQNAKVHKLVIEGLFGLSREIIKTKELMDRKNIADLNITCILLNYSDEDCKQAKNLTYQEEVSFIVQHTKRANFISNLALSLTGNTLILFKLVDKHGKAMYENIQSKNKNKIPVYFIHGKIDTAERNSIRSKIESHEKSIAIASVGVFSEGVNIKRIHNIILATPVKSETKNRQGIGRGLRLGNDKDIVEYYDIVDVLSKKGKKNYALQHFLERVKIYDEQQFNYKTYSINI